MNKREKERETEVQKVIYFHNNRVTCFSSQSISTLNAVPKSLRFFIRLLSKNSMVHKVYYFKKQK